MVPSQSSCSLLSHGSILVMSVRCGLIAGAASASSCSISALETLVPYGGNCVNNRNAVSSSLVVEVDNVSSSSFFASPVATKPHKFDSIDIIIVVISVRWNDKTNE